MSRLQWGGDDPFTHTIIVGPTRCGKTATLIKPIIYQILMAKAKGYPCGLSVIEPKGDVAQFTVDLARELGIPGTYHLDPTIPNSDMINLMKGPVDDVAEVTIGVLQGMFGRQEAFFQLMQELTARNFIKLLKINHGDNLDILTVLRTLRDDEIQRNETVTLAKSGKDPELVSYFEHEMKGKLGDKWKELAVGLRAQIEKLVSNTYIRRIITGDSGIDLDRHMAEGGVMGINTALKLGRSGDNFGQFMMMHLQAAAYRRPGTERTRIPHYLIVDEMSRYINPDIERFLSIAAEYRIASIFAVQSLSQLEIASGNLSGIAMKTAILTDCRNKISFGGITNNDAEYLAKEFGKNWVVSRQETFDGTAIASLLPKSYHDTEKEEYRIRPTDIQDGLPRFYYVHKLIHEGNPMKPGIAIGKFVPQDWREQAQQLQQSATPQHRGVFSLREILEKCGLHSTRERSEEESTKTNAHLKLQNASAALNEKPKIQIQHHLEILEPEPLNESPENAQSQIQEALLRKEMPVQTESKEKREVIPQPEKETATVSRQKAESLHDMNENFM